MTAAKFSILVTNRRNGGQHELTMNAPAENSDSWIRGWLAINRPQYMVKRIDHIREEAK